MSRLVLGMHGSNEVLFGSLLSAYFIILYRFYMYKIIEKYLIEKILNA